MTYNLDTQSVIQKTGEPGTLFGYSIAFHQQLHPAKKNLLLVGAPQSKHLGQENITGVVYRCDLSSPSQHCEPIHFDSKQFFESRNINGQWMGVRVTSQGPGKNIMTCAHRYQQWSPSPGPYVPHLLTGQCYILGDNLQVGNQDRTWRRVVCDYDHLSRRPINQDWFGLCQQGHGASFAKDGKSVIFGAPGAYQWKGIVRLEPLNDLEIYSSTPRETGNIEKFDSQLIPFNLNSYLGFSTDSGMALLEKDELTIVSGAPRGGYSGQVAFLRADPLTPSNLSVELVLSGPGLASSFGYDVAVVDLNSDGWDDLAVGAPQFYLKDSLVGGAVYIYINHKGKDWQNREPIRLLGQKESMFGLAVENIGDINQDGYKDIAVGAPYEGSGKVYIFCGSAEGIHRKAAQVLHSRDKAVSLFGYSLSGNLDIDDNGYPDLAVGSLSGSVFVFRARPVVSVNSHLRIKPNEIDLEKEQCNKKACYRDAHACFTWKAHAASTQQKMVLNYRFEVNNEAKTSRVRFMGSAHGMLELPGPEIEVCKDIRLRLLRDIKDKLSKIPISVTLSLLESNQSSRTGSALDTNPVLNLYHRRSSVSELILINSGCGSDNICQSNLQLQYRFCSHRNTNGKDVYSSLARDNGVAVITPSKEDIALEIKVTNKDGDDAHQARAVITLPNTLHHTSVLEDTANQPQVACTPNSNGTILDCDLGNPLRRDAQVIFYVKLSTSAILLSTTDISINLQLNTTSVQEVLPVEAVAKVAFELALQVYSQARPSQVTPGDSALGESAINSRTQMGPEIQFDFQIINLGRPLKSFANASLNIRWPKENAVGKWMLYLTQITHSGVQPIPCSPAREVDPLRSVKGWTEPLRRRRQVEPEALSSDQFTSLLTRRHKTLTCSEGLNCVEVRCPLVGLDSIAKVTLHSRLWNTTFTEDYWSLNYLFIVVDADVRLTNANENIRLKLEQASTQIKLTVFMEKKAEFYAKVAWWIIVLTVITGLLLLAVLAFVLWQTDWAKNLHKKHSHKEDPVTLTQLALLNS
ncbi:integrin alpha-6-like isoform X3 [Synchiropus splendidus]|uniref:integrin alpha-6-like isoform X3 n=2 Tax=Synchiropus splendidus TaxID=270530 RepID=UPI00237EE054|nr:integrin alpha-6-like isoform X3 [Synchiropus splendidus]